MRKIKYLLVLIISLCFLDNVKAYQINETFPDSYKPFVDKLKSAYPNWKFKALHTNLDYSQVISGEDFVTHPTSGTTSAQVYLRKSTTTNSGSYTLINSGVKVTIQDIVYTNTNTGCSNNSWYKVRYNNYTGYLCTNYVTAKLESRNLFNYNIDGWKSTSTKVYNFYTNKWNTNVSGGGSGWYTPNRSFISYMMDPRNYLSSEKDYGYIFMFLNQKYSTDTTYSQDVINTTLANTFMSTSKVNDGTDRTFAEVILTVSKEAGIDPYFLSARILVELSVVKNRSDSEYVSGTNSIYKGYYNYCNIGATGSNSLLNGLKTAKENGWDNDYKALKGCAEFIAGNYINRGQSTIYLQKFDVINATGNGFYTHQYQQNLTVGELEGYKLFQAYKEAKLLNSNLEFIIPVYNNMPVCNTTVANECTILPSKANPNNYLKNIKIDGYEIPNFDGSKEEYTYNVSTSTTVIQLDAERVYNKASISGIGTINLINNSQTIQIVVTAENGTKKIYKITITKDDTKPLSVSNIVSNADLVTDGTYLSGIALNTTGTDLSNKLKLQGKNINVNVITSSGQEKTSGIVSTGDKVTIKSGEETKIYKVVIYGDLNGDGIINSADLLKLRQHLIGTKKLSSEYFVAANLTKNDNTLNSADLLKLRQHLIGTNKIVQ